MNPKTANKGSRARSPFPDANQALGSATMTETPNHKPDLNPTDPIHEVIDPVERLLAVMARLRDPITGCPWDIEQTYETIAPYTIEEAYEVADAIAQGDMAHLKDELGDLLLQVVYYARMGEEDGLFDFAAIAGTIADKMIRRHPHVFGDLDITTADAQTVNWEDQKASERAAVAKTEGRVESVLDGVSVALPAMTRGIKLQKRVVRVGFDWPKADQVLDKIDEELAELRAEITADTVAPDRIEDELGDILFTVVNLARHLDVDPETALRSTNAKFERRFRRIETLLAETGRRPQDAELDEMEAFWQRAKLEE